VGWSADGETNDYDTGVRDEETTASQVLASDYQPGMSAMIAYNMAILR